MAIIPENFSDPNLKILAQLQIGSFVKLVNKGDLVFKVIRFNKRDIVFEYREPFNGKLTVWIKRARLADNVLKILTADEIVAEINKRGW